jgi:plasmid stabilization system protein ParE
MSAVAWTERARDGLADIYVQATPAEPDDIEAAVLALERDLAADPLGVGESRAGRLRFEVRTPLAFWFSVSPAADRVRIVRVRPSRRK